MQKVFISLMIALSCQVLSADGGAQPQESDSAHWAMASFLGTGWYKIDDMAGLALGVKWDPDTDFLGLTINFSSWFRR